jgi:hypothetical protein
MGGGSGALLEFRDSIGSVLRKFQSQAEGRIRSKY